MSKHLQRALLCTLLCVSCTETRSVSLGSAAPSDEMDAGSSNPDADDDDVDSPHDEQIDAGPSDELHEDDEHDDLGP